MRIDVDELSEVNYQLTHVLNHQSNQKQNIMMPNSMFIMDG